MALVNALNKNTPLVVGEKGNVEYTWSNDYMEKFSQFFFQLVRTDDTTKLEAELDLMITEFKKQYSQNTSIVKNIPLLTMLYKMVGQTRDIVGGKGEYNLAFAQIWVWYKHYPKLAKYAFEKCVRWNDVGNDFTVHPYGSWKDIKYFGEFVKIRSEDTNHPLIEFAVKLITEQIMADMVNCKEGKPISLAGKWCPREKSHFGWLYDKIVKQMTSSYFITPKTNKQRNAALRKGRREVRKILSQLNTYLKTTQIAQCAKEWKSIDFNTVTSITMRKNTLAFQNKTKQMLQRSTCIDRVECSDNFTKHIEDANVGGKSKVHGKRVAVYELVKDALRAENQGQEQRDVVNLQWEDNKTQNSTLKNFIAMADTSGSMTSDDCVPLYNSLGMAIRVSELVAPAFRDRVLTFSAHPEWVNLSECSTFCHKVYKLRECNWGMNTNFYGAMQMILDVIVKNAMPPNDVENLILAVFSDMQIDTASLENMDTMYESIVEMYSVAGVMSVYGVPYKPPHILMWNLRKTDGFPCSSTQKNVTMLSGYSPILMNVFYEKGMEGLRECTPYKMISELLDHKRYNPLDNKIFRELCG